MKISAVVACYRDAPAIPEMHQRLTAAMSPLGDHEIIFVNDGSPDDSRDVLAELAARDPHVVVVNHARAFGSQAAFTSGMRIATGAAVILLDGDLQDPPELIPEFVERWREGFDVVYGVRIQREAPRFMQFAYKLFYRLFQRLSYLPVALDAGDFGLMDRRVADAMNSLPESQRFLRGLRAWVGFRQTGVPYRRPARPFGESTNSLVRNFGWARRAIVSFSYVPLDAITAVALFGVVVTSVAGFGEVLLKIFVPDAAPKGFATLLTVVLFVAAVQLLCIGIIGSYLAHIYEEVKHRPAYIVESILNAPAGLGREPEPAGTDRHRDQ